MGNGQDSDTREEIIQTRILDVWQDGEVWFRDLIPENVPWGTEEELDPVPEGAEDAYGVKVAGYTQLDGVRYQPGEYITVGTREDFATLLNRVPKIEGFLVPWLDRLVSVTLAAPQTRPIDVAAHRAGLQMRLVKSLVMTVLLVGAGYVFPEYKMLSLLAAAFFGLFPLVETLLLWTRKVDRLSVDELNRRLVNYELFRLWVTKRKATGLKWALGLLVLIFAGQVYVGLEPSIESAALVKEEVLKKGEWWRLVTTGLMHGSIVHILFNGMAFYNLGRVLTALSNSKLLTIVFLLSVIAGSLASLFFSPAPASVGASGGILGCLGFLLVITWKFRGVVPGFLQANCIQATIVLAIFGFFGRDFIDNAAHAGGFVCGILVGIVFYRSISLGSSRSRLSIEVLFFASLAVLLAAAVKVGVELFRILN